MSGIQSHRRATACSPIQRLCKDQSNSCIAALIFFLLSSKSMKALLIYLLIPLCTATQWPGYFYSFTLADTTGKLITVNNKDYKFTAVKPAKGDIMLDILMCADSTTLRFYTGGFHGLSDTHKLEIIKLSSKEKMMIEFPSSLSGGKEQYYRNLFVGKLVFKKGTYQIKLPASGGAWNNLREKHFCPDFGGNDSYWDISNLQKQ